MVELSRAILKEFADATNNSSESTAESKYVRGTVTTRGESKYVKIDGSTMVTPISQTIDVQEGDRVLVSIENHQAIVLGNFTYPPSARKEQEAIDKAESAGSTASIASEKAESAIQNANEAMQQAGASNALAQQAVQSASEAITAANTAGQKADEAKTEAAQATTNANTAVTNASQALASVADAQEEIDLINQEVTNVKGDINDALTDLNAQAGEITAIKQNYTTKVETENVKAELSTEISTAVGQLQTTISQNYAAKTDIVEMEGKLQTQITQNANNITSHASKIETLESDTAAAQEDITEALNKAQAAQTAADQAQANATTAQAAADEAKTNAETAAQKAADASQEALDAKLAAYVADEALTEARTNLEEARTNYELVVNNPSSTEEQIQQAQAAVDAAIVAVNTALANASTAAVAAQEAQAAADQANLDAQQAQSAATAAQNKADQAQTVADSAMSKAEAAQQEIAALTQRVTTAETSISQNAEEITLVATKTDEIGSKLENNYYTKEETEAQIQISADSITSTVTSTISGTVKEEIDKINIGSTNLLLNSKFDNDINNWEVSANQTPNENLLMGTNHTITSTSFVHSYRIDSDKIPAIGTECTISWKATVQGDTFTGFDLYYDESEENLDIKINTENIYIPDENGIYSYTFNWNHDWLDITYITLEVPATADCQVSVEWIKLEEGGAATSWVANENDSDGVNLLENASFDSNGTGYPENIINVGGTTGTYGGWFIGSYGNYILLNPKNGLNNSEPECFSAYQSSWQGMVLIHQNLSSKITSEDIGKYLTISINTDSYIYTNGQNPYIFYLYGFEYSVVSGSINLANSSSGVSFDEMSRKSVIIKINNITNPNSIAIGLQLGDSDPETNSSLTVLFNKLKVEKGYNPNPDWGDPVTGDVEIVEPETTADTTTIEIVTVDNVTSAVINANSSEYIEQNVVSRLITEDKDTNYVYAADVNFVNTSATGSPTAELYIEGKYTDSTGALKDVVVTDISGTNDISTLANQGWNRLVWKLSLDHIPNDSIEADYLNVGIRGSGFDGNLYFKNLKFEKGTNATDWSPSPTDVYQNVDSAKLAASNAQSSANSALEQISNAQSTITQLSDSISMLVVDENGQSMMTQTSDGWVFNIGGIQENLDNATSTLNSLTGDINDINNTAETLKNSLNDITAKTAYIRLGVDENGDPCIILGKEDDDFQVRITNHSIDFLAGTSRVAYISHQALYIERAVIKDELQIGEGTGFVWKKRSSGNMGLRWVGG